MDAQAVVVPKDIHKEGPTHGHKNTPAQIQSDANDLSGAAARDANAMVTNSTTMDPANTANYQDAANRITSKTNDDHDNFLTGIMGGV